jgi:hypothetical protein
MLTEHWDGATWRDVPNTGIMFHDEVLQAVAASSATDAWAVGFSRVTNNYGTTQLTAHWDGTAWSVVPTGTTGNRDRLSSVVAFSATDVYAAGVGNGQGAIEHWTGSAWNPVTLPSLGPAGATTTVTSLSAKSPTDVWALAQESHVVGTTVVGSVVSLHFDGVSWRATPTATVSGPFRLTAITEVAPGNIWAVGQTIKTDGTGASDKALIEHFDGTTWHRVTAPATGLSPTLTGVVARSASDVWAVGSFITAGFPVDRTLTLHYDGVSWSTVDSPNTGSTDNLLRAVAASTTEVWAVGQTLNGTNSTLVLRHG